MTLLHRLRQLLLGLSALLAAVPAFAAADSPSPYGSTDAVRDILQTARVTHVAEPDLAALAKQVGQQLAWGLGERLEHLMVQVQDGSVLATGRVATAEDRDEAQRRVARLDHAERVTLLLEAADGSQAAPAPTPARAQTAFVSPVSFVTDDGRAARHLLLDDTSGVVTLTGEVNGPRARQMCLAAAHAMPGTRAVIDHLTVRKPSPREDRNLEQIVRFRLREHAELLPYLDQSRRPARERVRHDLLEVEVQDGVVILTGAVRSPALKALAVSLTDDLRGTFLVDDRLAVDPGLEEPSLDTRPRIESRFHGTSIYH